MESLIRTTHTDIPKPFETTVSLDQEDFYYVKNNFKLDLTKQKCKTVSDELTLEQCKSKIQDEHTSKEELNKILTRVLCENKAAATQLQDYQTRLNGSTQGLDDTKEFYNTLMIQTVNLSLGILVLLSGTIYYFGQS